MTVRLQDIAALEQLVEMRLQQKPEVRRIGALNPDMLLDVDATSCSAGTRSLITHWQAEMTPVGA